MSSDYSIPLGVQHHHHMSGLFVPGSNCPQFGGGTEGNMDFREAYVHGNEERPMKRANLLYMSNDTHTRGINEATHTESNIGKTEVNYMDQDDYMFNESAIVGVDGQKFMKGVRRLGYEQVKALEKAFEGDNRLEPERKVKLASELSLQPRQVAIWFQNRRARWKTKQLEKDYSLLKSNFDALKAERDILLQEKQHLQDQLARLKGGVRESKGTNPHGEHDSITLTSCANVHNQDSVIENDQNIEIRAFHPKKQDNDSITTSEGSESNGVIDEPSSAIQVEDSTKKLANENDFNNNHWRLTPHQQAYKSNIKNEESWENTEENAGSFNISIDWYW